MRKTLTTCMLHDSSMVLLEAVFLSSYPFTFRKSLKIVSAVPWDRFWCWLPLWAHWWLSFLANIVLTISHRFLPLLCHSSFCVDSIFSPNHRQHFSKSIRWMWVHWWESLFVRQFSFCSIYRKLKNRFAFIEISINDPRMKWKLCKSKWRNYN